MATPQDIRMTITSIPLHHFGMAKKKHPRNRINPIQMITIA